MKYLKFQNLNASDCPQESFLSRCLAKLLGKILPNANPDFESRFNLVRNWLIEYDDEKEFTNREIGLNQNGEAITKAPYLKNLGIWCDSDLKLSDYNQFEPTPISSELFDSFWSTNITTA